MTAGLIKTQYATQRFLANGQHRHLQQEIQSDLYLHAPYAMSTLRVHFQKSLLHQ
jgi:hypothetical protein